MDQILNFGDKRQTDHCVYCGSATGTRDHIPSKVFLDKPYPTNLPVVPACESCNNGFSKDEEYVACLIECVSQGSVLEETMQREKIKRILKQRPALAERMKQAHKTDGSKILFSFEFDRLKNIILKLACGHAAYDLNEPMYHNEPYSIGFTPLESIPKDIRRSFETPPKVSILPEIGSRAMQRLIMTFPGPTGWIIVQPGRYRYLTSVIIR
ncbi:MAG: hypothetical protein ACYDEQ_04045 [Desulfocucumaceae bacterium]